MRKNPNTNIVLIVFKFKEQTNTFSLAGRSGLLKASQTLLIIVNSNVTGTVESKSIDYQSISELKGYVPYYDDLDIQARLPAVTENTSTSTNQNHMDEDPYFVETIVAKRFNTQKVQYEYLVKWLGYASSENTWELPTNIPNQALDSLCTNRLSSLEVQYLK